MTFTYIPDEDEYRIYEDDSRGHLMTAVPAECVRSFVDNLPSQSEAYQLLAYIGYMTMALTTAGTVMVEDGD